MGYRVRLTIEAGRISLDATPDVPDGVIVITGHTDTARNDSINATRYAPDGKTVMVTASCQVRRTDDLVGG